jgi:hypothetical protein
MNPTEPITPALATDARAIPVYVAAAAAVLPAPPPAVPDPLVEVDVDPLVTPVALVLVEAVALVAPLDEVVTVLLELVTPLVLETLLVVLDWPLTDVVPETLR